MYTSKYFQSTNTVDIDLPSNSNNSHDRTYRTGKYDFQSKNKVDTKIYSKAVKSEILKNESRKGISLFNGLNLKKISSYFKSERSAPNLY